VGMDEDSVCLGERHLDNTMGSITPCPTRGSAHLHGFLRNAEGVGVWRPRLLPRSLFYSIHSGRQNGVRSSKAGHGSGADRREGHCRSKNRRDHDLQSQGTGCVEREKAGELL
jgi:hypothetical protein